MSSLSFWASLRAIYARSAAFLIKLPALGLLIVGVEALQHIVEWRDGTYASRAGLVAAGSDPHRLIAGTLKVFWLLLVGFWVMRFFVSGSGRVALQPSRIAVQRFAVVLLVMATFSLLAIWPPALVSVGSTHHRDIAMLAALSQLVTFPISVALTPWLVGAALGEPRLGPITALRRAYGFIWWGLALNVVAILPIMILHYVLGLGPVGQPAPIATVMLTIDALVVGYLGVVIGSVNVPVAARMASRAGERLIVDPA